MNRISFLIISFLCSFLYSEAHHNVFKIQSKGENQQIFIGQTFYENVELSVFGGIEEISALSVTMDITALSSDFLVRVILEDIEGTQYLVLESYKEVSNNCSNSYNQYCEETNILNNTHPAKLIIIINNASVTLHSVSYITERQKYLKSLMTDIRNEQVKEKVNQINAYNKAHDKLWIAGVTDLAMMPYADRIALLGVPNDVGTCGIEYYTGGLFELGDLQSMTVHQSSSNYVDEFDWRNRHGKNLMTSIQNQFTTPYCTAFAVVAGVEASANLYYNKRIDFDLSEQEIACCAKYNKNPQNGKVGINPDSALIYARDNGIVLEDDYPFSITALQICHSDEINPTDIVKISGYSTDVTSSSNSEDLIKYTLINKGPLVSWILAKSLNHAMLLVGYGQVKEGLSLRNYFPHLPDSTSTISAGDPRIGMTYWKFKNSWGLSYNNGMETGQRDGYMYMLVDTLSIFYKMYSISTPITSLQYTNDSIVCEDLDGDGFYNWGIGPKPSHSPSWVPDTPDGDDSDYSKGPMDEYGYLRNISDMQSDSTIYISQDTAWSSRKYVYYPVYVYSGKTLRVTNDINFYRGVTLNLAAGSKLIVDGGSLTDVSINYVGTSGTSIEIINNGSIKYLENQDFSVPLGTELEMNYGTIN